MARVLEELSKQDATDFAEAEFVALNALAADGAVRQMVFKANGTYCTSLDGELCAESVIEPQFGRTATGWSVVVTCPWPLLGSSFAEFANRPLPFDLVRHRSALAVVTAWCPIPDHPPFGEQYRFPVFRFGLLGSRAGVWNDVVGSAVEVGSLNLEGTTGRVVAGDYLRLRYTYTVGAAGLRPGAGLRFALCNEVIECNRRSPVIRHLPEKDWSPVQWDDPTQPGFMTAGTNRDEAKISFARDDLFAVTARLESREPLRPGDTITLEVGTDRRGPGLRAQLLTQTGLRFKFYVDAFGHNVWHALEVPPLTVVGGAAQRLVLHTPATPRPDAPFQVQIVAIDRYGNLAADYRGRIRLYAPKGTQNLPETIEFTAADAGVAKLNPTLPAGVVGVFRAVDTTDSALNGESNLVVTTDDFGDAMIVFGDIHTHSQGSDGRLTPEDKVCEVRHLRGCDCWALTDHCHDLTPERQQRQNQVIDAAEEAGVFAVLPAYEWSNSMGEKRPCVRPWLGHRNVYFDAPPLVVFDGVAEASNTLDRLKARLVETGREHVIINHFHCGKAEHRPGIDDGAEISGWATSFLRDAPGGDGYIGDVLDTGADTAVVAGSDHGSEAYYHGLPTELTAFYVPQLDRKQVFAALKSGRTYASTGVKTLLKFLVNGMGPHLGHARIQAAERRLEITVGSHLPVINVQVLRNGRVVHNFNGFTFGVRHYAWDDPERGGCGHYMLRINVAQGHRVWSSPVFYKETH